MRRNETCEGAEGGGWLRFAASPTFIAMAVASAVASDDPAHLLCQAMGHAGLPLDGMTSMYLLMAVFHASPWWQWIASRRRSCTRNSGASADPAAIESRGR